MIHIKGVQTVPETTVLQRNERAAASGAESGALFASALSSETRETSDFEGAFQSIIKNNKGFQDGKNPMKYGIMQSTLITCDPKGQIAPQVKDLTEAGARKIYARLWDRAGCRELSSPLNVVHFDTFVQRPSTAMKLLTESDGDLNAYLRMREKSGLPTVRVGSPGASTTERMNSTEEFLRQSRIIAKGVEEPTLSPSSLKRCAPDSKPADFESAVSFVISQEGNGLVSNDNGAGRSKFGILQKTLRQIDPRGRIAKDVSQLDERKAKAVYRKIWEQTGCNKLPSPLNVVHFDTMVHSPRTAARALEASDGNPKAYLETRLSALKSLKSYRKYGRNWANRIEDLSRLIR